MFLLLAWDRKIISFSHIDDPSETYNTSQYDTDVLYTFRVEGNDQTDTIPSQYKPNIHLIEALT